MSNYIFRYEPKKTDLVQIEEILKASGFFKESEVEIALSLFEDKINNKENSTYQFVILENKDKILGYSCFGFIDGTETSFDLYWIAVNQNLKRKGFGTIILKETERIIRREEGVHIYIETSSTLLYKPTRHFYEKNSYTIEARIKDFYDINDDKIIYSKKLIDDI